MSWLLAQVDEANARLCEVNLHTCGLLSIVIRGRANGLVHRSMLQWGYKLNLWISLPLFPERKVMKHIA